MSDDLDDFARRLGATLRTLRKARRWTQADVVERLGGDVALETISRFERASSIPSLPWIARLAKLYDVTLDDIVRQTLADPGPARLSSAQSVLETTRALDDQELAVVSDIVSAYVAAVTRRRSTPR
jgi:transcriptional regulator with XRE-family HTH domain